MKNHRVKLKRFNCQKIITSGSFLTTFFHTANILM